MVRKLTVFDYIFFAVVLVVLIVAIWLDLKLHHCDTMKCGMTKCCNDNDSINEAFSKLNQALYTRSFWTSSYIAATILSLVVCIWMKRDIPTMKDFFVILLVSFVTCYFLQSFSCTHYTKPIAMDLMEKFKKMEKELKDSM